MRRHSFRRSLRLETLESRELLTAGGPTAEAQYMLYLTNLARTNPGEASQLFTQNLNPSVQATVNYYGANLQQAQSQIANTPATPPLAWNAELAQAAVLHSQDMANNGFQSHNGSDGSTTQQRISAAGYTNSTVNGENAYSYATSVDQAMDAFMIDWGVSDHGHRNNIQQPGANASQLYQEVGIGIVQSNNANVGPEVITQDFGTQPGKQAQVLGVVFNDPSHTNLYSLGSGVGNVTIQATNLNTGATSSVQSWDQGGYQIPLAPGSYKITAIDNGVVVNSQQIGIGSQNVEVDFDLSNPWQNTPVNPPAPTPVVSIPIVSTPVVSTPMMTTPVVSTPVAPSSQPYVIGMPLAQAQSVIQQNQSQSQNLAQQTLTVPVPTAAVPPAQLKNWFTGWSSWFARNSQ